MITTTTFYSSSNGDRCQMVYADETRLYQVRHELNMASGGQATETPMPMFISQNGATPQGAALQKILEERGAIDLDLDA